MKAFAKYDLVAAGLGFLAFGLIGIAYMFFLRPDSVFASGIVLFSKAAIASALGTWGAARMLKKPILCTPSLFRLFVWSVAFTYLAALFFSALAGVLYAAGSGDDLLLTAALGATVWGLVGAILMFPVLVPVGFCSTLLLRWSAGAPMHGGASNA